MTQEKKQAFKIAAATKSGLYVDEHFGAASELVIFEGNGKTFTKLESRSVNNTNVIDLINDCDAILTLPVSHFARKKLTQSGIKEIEYKGLIKKGLIVAMEQLLA